MAALVELVEALAQTAQPESNPSSALLLLQAAVVVVQMTLDNPAVRVVAQVVARQVAQVTFLQPHQCKAMPVVTQHLATQQAAAVVVQAELAQRLPQTPLEPTAAMVLRPQLQELQSHAEAAEAAEVIKALAQLAEQAAVAEAVMVTEPLLVVLAL